jgi:hypothetical protein
MNRTVTTAPRVVLADDHPEILQTIAFTLRDKCDVVGTAENGRRAIELVTELSPDILVLDICMPVVNGRYARRYLHLPINAIAVGANLKSPLGFGNGSPLEPQLRMLVSRVERANWNHDNHSQIERQMSTIVHGSCSASCSN